MRTSCEAKLEELKEVEKTSEIPSASRGLAVAEICLFVHVEKLVKKCFAIDFTSECELGVRLVDIAKP